METDSFVTVRRETETRFTEKKSVFITRVKPVETEDEAKAFIEAARADFQDATHHVYAYINREGNATRFSDDGEPQGTAGMPVYEVIRREGLTGVCIVVIRYFGGVLLGAGGLVRAYSRGANDAVKEAGICRWVKKELLNVSVDYDSAGRVRRELEKLGVAERSVSYGEKVEITVICSRDAALRVDSAVADATRGACRAARAGSVYAAEDD